MMVSCPGTCPSDKDSPGTLADIPNVPRLSHLRERLMGVGAVPTAGSPEELGAYFRSEVENFGKIVRATRLKIE